MRKLKIYLDTSVISHLDHKDTLEKMEQTHKLWEIIKSGKYDVVLGTTVFEEIEECSEEKKEILYHYLSKINYSIMEKTETIRQLANEIIEQGILKKKHMDDCEHIATAILSDCNIIVSWNFKHMVNVDTINGIRTIAVAKRFTAIDVYPPNLLLKGEDEDEQAGDK